MPFAKDDSLNQVMFGTVWLSAKNNEFISISSYNENVAKKYDAGNLEGILKANTGRSVIVKISGKEPLEAKIAKVTGDMVFLDGKNSWQAINIYSIESIEFPNKPNMIYTDSIEKKVLKLDFKKKEPKQPVDFMYMQKGLTWVPNYNIELREGKKARLKLRANVMNDIEDIENADVNFVVGIPTFLYSDKESPITSNMSVFDFLGINQYNRYPWENMSFKNSISNTTYTHEIVKISDEFQVPGSENEDLFLYTLKKLTLRKGGCGLFDLLATEVEYEDLYSVELESSTQYNNYYSKSDDTNEVWHSIRFTNNTKTPLTTGTAFITKANDSSNAPISQNKLNYTPASAKCVVKLTVAPDISVTDSEVEMERKQRSKIFRRLLS